LFYNATLIGQYWFCLTGCGWLPQSIDQII